MIPKSAFLSAALLCLATSKGAATCPPSFAAIHDYRPGDVFQYHSESSSGMGGFLKRETWRKVRILSRSDNGDTKTYQVHIHTRYDEGRVPEPRTRAFSEEDTTLAFVDSSKHSLNACAGDAVPIPSPGFGNPRIETSDGDTAWFPLASSGLAMKRISITVVDPPEGPVMPPMTEVRVYAEGLGMVRRIQSGPMYYSLDESMSGFTRVGQTRGKVLTDPEMSQPVALKPAAASGVRAGLAVAGHTGIGIDLRGRSLKQPRGWNLRVTP
jgi:hypothetical protein